MVKTIKKYSVRVVIKRIWLRQLRSTVSTLNRYSKSSFKKPPQFSRHVVSKEVFVITNVFRMKSCDILNKMFHVRLHMIGV
jgi:hypothetical protein